MVPIVSRSRSGFPGPSRDGEHGSTAGRHAAGDRPACTAYQCAQMMAKMAVDMSRCAALLIGAGRTAQGIETETRAALETGSVAWCCWKRICRPGAGVPHERGM